MGFAAVTFALVIGVILSAYWLFIVRTEEQQQQSLHNRLRKGSVREKARSEVLKATEPSSSLAGFDRLLNRLEVVNKPLRVFIEASGVRITPGLLILMTGVCFLATYLLVDFFSPWHAVAVVVGLVAAWAPSGYLSYRRTKRLRKFEEQFPDAIDLIARALRAGHAFTTGLGMVAEEVPDPVGAEFRLLYEHQNFGLPLPEAMKRFAERVPLLDARFFVTAVLTQREAGGNLSEVLDNLAAVIRERFKVKRQVRVLSAHGRITGWVLVALPPIMAVVFFLIIPDTMRLLITDPLGVNMVIAAVIMQVVGTLAIRKLVDIEYLKVMPIQIIAAIVVVFISVAVAAATATNLVLSRTAPERRRLRELGKEGGAAGLILDTPRVTNSLTPLAQRVAGLVPKSPSELSALRRQLTTAGFRELSAAIYYSAAKIVAPIALAIVAFLIFGIVRGWLAMLAAAIAGFILPDLWLARTIKLRQKAIRNGLPDALDLFIVCLEAGSSLDQSIMKASQELEVAHPALADELKLITTEIRAGKPRLEALKNFSDRTKVADVRALVSMLVQTDRFGTSVAQALRTHAETSRTQRRQRAEERAAKIGVKLVFPLVFLLFPALYIVILGPAVIRFVRVFMEQAMQGALQ